MLCTHFGITNSGPITYKSPPMNVRKNAMPIGIVSKGRIDSDISKCLAIKGGQHNILSESITYQETSLAAENMGKHKRLARLNFSELKGLYAYLGITASLMNLKLQPNNVQLIKLVKMMKINPYKQKERKDRPAA